MCVNSPLELAGSLHKKNNNTLEAIREEVPLFWQDCVSMLSFVKCLHSWIQITLPIRHPPSQAHSVFQCAPGLKLKLKSYFSTAQNGRLLAGAALQLRGWAGHDWPDVYKEMAFDCLPCPLWRLQHEAAKTLPFKDKIHLFHSTASSPSSKDQSFTEFIKMPLLFGRLV